MARASLNFAWLPACLAILLMVGQASVHAQSPGEHGERDRWRPVYQRRAFEWADKNRHFHGHRPGHLPVHVPHAVAPPVSSGWFQRPYPYHLDYYKMRYGGSYAPYFGNLYGPPQVVTAPPYYGPYYGDYGNGYPGGYGQQGAYGYPAPPPNNESLSTP